MPTRRAARTKHRPATLPVALAAAPAAATAASTVRAPLRRGRRDVLILGSGIHGLEMAEILERANAARPARERRRLLGYISNNAQHVGRERNGYRVLGTFEDLARFPNAELIHDNEWPESRAVPRERLGTLIDPGAFVSRTARIGAGVVIYPHCYVGANAVIGDEVFMLSGCVVNHDDQIGARVVFASAVTLAGSVTVEAGCYLGQSCSVRQYLKIERGSLIGMGAVVIAAVEPYSVMVGNPATCLRKQEPPKESKPKRP